MDLYLWSLPLEHFAVSRIRHSIRAAAGLTRVSEGLISYLILQRYSVFSNSLFIYPLAPKTKINIHLFLHSIYSIYIYTYTVTLRIITFTYMEVISVLSSRLETQRT